MIRRWLHEEFGNDAFNIASSGVRARNMTSCALLVRLRCLSPSLQPEHADVTGIRLLPSVFPGQLVIVCKKGLGERAQNCLEVACVGSRSSVQYACNCRVFVPADLEVPSLKLRH